MCSDAHSSAGRRIEQDSWRPRTMNDNASAVRHSRQAENGDFESNWQYVFSQVESMNTKRVTAVALAWLLWAAFVSLQHTNADAADEMKRLAAVMEWKAGTVVADIGAGDGRFAFAAAQLVGASGKVFATEIDQEKLAKLRSEVAKRHLNNVIVLESKEADTNLPPQCCDAIFLRRVYHHLTQPAEFDAALVH